MERDRSDPICFTGKQTERRMVTTDKAALRALIERFLGEREKLQGELALIEASSPFLNENWSTRSLIRAEIAGWEDGIKAAMINLHA
jgi:hypothetical protein